MVRRDFGQRQHRRIESTDRKPRESFELETVDDFEIALLSRLFLELPLDGVRGITPRGQGFRHNLVGVQEAQSDHVLRYCRRTRRTEVATDKETQHSRNFKRRRTQDSHTVLVVGLTTDETPFLAVGGALLSQNPGIPAGVGKRRVLPGERGVFNRIQQLTRQLLTPLPHPHHDVEAALLQRLLNQRE